GGGSSVWGNYALGGVIHLRTLRPTGPAAALEASYGSRDTAGLDLLLQEARGPLRLSLEGDVFGTGGYPVVRASRRGPIDIDADSEHATVNGRLEVVASPDASLFFGGTFFDEHRGNGTPLQENETTLGAFATGGRLRAADGSVWSLTLFGQVQEFRSTFSSQSL